MKVSYLPIVTISIILGLVVKSVFIVKEISVKVKDSFITKVSSELISNAYAIDTKTKDLSQVDTNASSPETTTVQLKGQNIPENMNVSEYHLLQNLSKRNQELQKNQQSIALQKAVLKATEEKVEQKIKELTNLQKDLQALLKEYKQRENLKIKSLVKIYENMKPKDAAKIFDDLEMPILFEIINNMKEMKVANILANMNTTKARELSVEFAKQKSLNLRYQSLDN